MTRSLLDEISSLVHSGWRLIAFESFEEDRALRVLERVAQQHRRTLLPWSVAAGLGESGKGSGSLEDGLRAIEEIEEPGIFALLDAHLEAGNPNAVRRLRDMLPVLSQRKQCVVLIGPTVDLPLELSREAGHARLPLPRAEELTTLFQRAVDVSKDPQSAEVLDACVRGALGLTAAESIRVLRRSIALAGLCRPGALVGV